MSNELPPVFQAGLPRQKRIIIVNNNLKIGGVQASLCNLLWALAAENRVTLVLFARTGSLLARLPPGVAVREAGFWLRPLGLAHAETGRGPLRVWSLLVRGLTKLLGRRPALRLMLALTPPAGEEYDLAVAYLQDPGPKTFYGGCNEYLLQKVRAGQKITFLHCDFARYGGDTPQNRRVLAQFDRIALVSQSCKRQFDALAPELAGKSLAVPNRICPAEICALAAQAPLCYPPGCIHLISVCRLAREKGLDRLLAAFARAEARLPGRLMLHLVGDGPLGASLRAQARRLGLEGRVRFYGEQANPYRYMRHADWLVVASLQEAAPLVIDEALALGLRVLSTRTLSAEEQIPPGRGRVCENSEQGLYRALVQLAEQGREKTECPG